MPERITLDPVTEDITNAPVELISPDDDQIIGLISHLYSAPQLELQLASSVDTEGELVASRRYRNRQIPISVEICDPGLAAATNKATNPKAAIGTTGWTNSSLTLMERQTTLPARLDPFDTALHATGNADDDAAYLSAAVTNGVAETFTAWVYVVSGTVRLEVWTAGPANFASSSNITVGSWQKIVLPYTPNATATWTFRVCQNGAGTCEFYVTGMQIGPAYPYFDGDTLGCSWSGTRHASTSTRPAGSTRAAAALVQFQAKAAKIGREGGTYRRVLVNGETITFDLVAHESYEPTFDQAYHLGGLAAVQVTNQAKPYGRGPEVTLSDHVETTLPWLLFTETTVKGDVPGLARLVVDNDEAAQAQQFLLWGIRSRYYDSASTAALFYQAESCALLSATATTRTGASGSGNTVAGYTTLPGVGGFDPLLYLGSSSTAQTHVGTYRVLVRAQAPAANTGTVSLRMQWKEAVGAPFITETEVAMSRPIADRWEVIELGMVTLSKAARGTQGWLGFLQAGSTVTNDDVYVDWIAFVPVDEGSGQAEHSSIASGQSMEVAYDGVRASTSGGYWTTPDVYEGDFLLVPPAGAEARTVEVFAKFMREPLGTLVSGGAGAPQGDFIDDLSARLFYSPRYLVVPAP